MDVDKLRAFIRRVGPENIPFGSLTITNNAGGGQPVSLANIRAVRGVSRVRHPVLPRRLPLCRERLFVKLREPGYANRTPLEIAREIFSLADGAWMSAKKDALVNIGGFLATRDAALYERISNELILREGFVTYGGLSGRDMDAMATGLWEGLDENYLAYRLAQTEYLYNQLHAAGIPTIEPAGGHAVYVDAGRMLPHIPTPSSRAGPFRRAVPGRRRTRRKSVR